LVVFVFLRDQRANANPWRHGAISIIGTFAAMYLFGYSLNNFSLMALTIATGFRRRWTQSLSLENIAPPHGMGRSRLQAALKDNQRGRVLPCLSISLSLSVFFADTFDGRNYRSVISGVTITLSVAVMISLVLSLTATPMMCSKLLARRKDWADELVFPNH